MLHVLVVDDDAAFRGTYERLLTRLGYTCRLAATRQEAKALWDKQEQRFDVVLLDQRLQSGGRRDDGIDLLREVRFSTAKVIMITGFESDDSVNRAFEYGVYDYLVKGQVLETLLAAKLDQIRETLRAKQRFSDENEVVIKGLWRDLDVGTVHARGRRLEELVLRLMTSVPGFEEASRNLRTKSEELDVVLRNESTDGLWGKLPPYILCEAKNWSRSVGTPEVAWFADKLRERPGANCGFLFAAQGFSEPVQEKVRSYRKEGLAMVLVDREAIRDLVEADDRTVVLKALHAHWALS